MQKSNLIVKDIENKHVIFITIILTFIGSAVNFYATNLFYADLANMFFMSITWEIFATLPMLILAVELVAQTIGLIKFGAMVRHRKRLAELYSSQMVVLSFIGVVCTIIAAVKVYGSFLSPYPFPGYLLIMIVVHLAIIGFFTFTYIQVKENFEPDPENRAIRGKGMFLNAAFAVIGYIAFNRFGALLFFPVYFQPSTFGLSFWYYSTLLFPLALFINVALYIYGKFENVSEMRFVYIVVVMILDVIIGGYVFCFGLPNPAFVASVSPINGLERLVTYPIDTIALYGITFLYAGFLAWVSLKQMRGKIIDEQY